MSRRDLNLLVSANVRHLRLAKGWSQEELAARCNLHRTYVGAIERGERNITLNTLEQVAGALGVDAVRLLAERDPDAPTERRRFSS